MKTDRLIATLLIVPLIAFVCIRTWREGRNAPPNNPAPASDQSKQSAAESASDPSEPATQAKAKVSAPAPTASEITPARPAFPKLGDRWENSLGMKFVPVPGTGVLFSVWDTRVQDFEAFVSDTSYDATRGMFSLGKNGWKQRGKTWKDTGYSQGPTHPVGGVSWEDAKTFCQWLTEKERKAGLIAAGQSYRLPTDAEWSAAVGSSKYPWGNQWPPPAGAGNYAGSEARDGDWPDNRPLLEGYRDGYPRTSPVGSFAANRYGLYDMGGNVWQWCEDWYRAKMNDNDVIAKEPSLMNDGGGLVYRVTRGAGWCNSPEDCLRSSYRDNNARPTNRVDAIGFRCVLVVAGG